MHRPISVAALMLVGAALLTPAARAASSPESACHKSRYVAAAKYDACEKKQIGNFFGDDDLLVVQSAVYKCFGKYLGTWARLQAKHSGLGTTCDNPRFEDNGDGTVTDRLTGLQWEQKTDDGTIHDTDDAYTLSDLGDADATNADGTAHTIFLATLNTGPCFAGHCDWRLPTRGELQTILREASPCSMHPCIDELTFGPLGTSYYWSSTDSVGNAGGAWDVFFNTGRLSFGSKSVAEGVRAVRGGL